MGTIAVYLALSIPSAMAIGMVLRRCARAVGDAPAMADPRNGHSAPERGDARPPWLSARGGDALIHGSA